ncbi:hypothetical protein [Frondihabitans peucedani]|uniref:Uncharacterized protein n=1 Tax=Frondihabitans peucedani TaxID=598626 RepID=A0ABP8E6U8_9MICO
MTSRSGRLAALLIGVIVVIIGAVFAGQGLNLIPGSSMTGERMWFYIGGVMVIVGLILVWLGVRRVPGGRS